MAFLSARVAIDGTIVVGARGTNDAGSSSGAVYVFRTSDGGATHGQVAKLTAADGERTTFGNSVAIDGAPSWSGPTTTGNLALQKRWIARLRLPHDRRRRPHPGGQADGKDAMGDDDLFGHSVAIDGTPSWSVHTATTMAGSASGCLRLPHDRRRCHVRRVAKLTAVEAASTDYFGSSVAIDGTTVVVRLLQASGTGGAVYVFRTTDGGATYGQVAKLDGL